MEPLPTPRQFLSSLISSLPETNPPQNPNTPQTQTSSNPLASLSQGNRNILITLHVLYPSILLHSLDLLDRGLVTKVIQTTEEPASTEEQIEIPVWQNQSERTEKVSDPKEKQNSIYQVQSAQTPWGSRARHQNHTSRTPKTYTVRLGAWHCSCAAFVFSAFPAAASTFSSSGDTTHDVMRDEGVGGMSFDGMDLGDGKDGGVAMCKHLLACLLVERWGGVLGGYLKERKVGRNEMAGLGADV